MRFIKNKVIALLVLIASVLVGHFEISQIQNRQKLESQQITMQSIAYLANAIDQQLSMSLSSTKALGSLIQQYGDIRDFDAIAMQMLEIYGGISCLQIAPGGTITKCYPLKGNEKIIGGNPITNPKRRTESLKALESGKLTLAGPFELSQGGIGAIGRYPVFITNKNGKRDFWGLTIAIINLKDLLDRCGINKFEKLGYDYWIWRIEPDSGTTNIFASTGQKLDLNNTVNFTIAVPNNTWTISAIPKIGWIDKQTTIIWHIILLFISSLIAIVVYFLLQKTALLRIKTQQLKESEKRLIEANASKDKFFTIIAHDLKGPVGSLLNISQYLFDNYLDMNDKDRMELVSYMKEGSNRTISLLDNLFLWARSQKGIIEWNPIQFNINEPINNVIELFKNSFSQKQLEVITNLETNFIVFADKDMITTIIRNLVSNAIKFTPKNGTIKISCSLSGINTCEIMVQDSGIGIPSEKLKHLFQLDKTQSTKGTDDELGTGLGLLICKEFVEKNNGIIRVESEQNKGSIFCFTIPLNSQDSN